MSVSRIKALLAATVLSAAGLVAGVVPAANAAPAKAASCFNYGTGGYIGAKYHQLGGPNGGLGCPTSWEYDIGPRRGRAQNFERGNISWTPDTGGENTVAAWHQGRTIFLNWGPTNPFHYDGWLVRMDRNGYHVGQYEYRNGWAGIGAQRGQTTFYNQPAGWYRFIVEGCDINGSHTCRQGWTNPVTFYFPG